MTFKIKREVAQRPSPTTPLQDNSPCMTAELGYLAVHDFPGQDTSMCKTPGPEHLTVHDFRATIPHCA